MSLATKPCISVHDIEEQEIVDVRIAMKSTIDAIVNNKIPSFVEVHAPASCGLEEMAETLTEDAPWLRVVLVYVKQPYDPFKGVQFGTKTNNKLGKSTVTLRTPLRHTTPKGSVQRFPFNRFVDKATGDELYRWEYVVYTEPK